MFAAVAAVAILVRAEHLAVGLIGDRVDLELLLHVLLVRRLAGIADDVRLIELLIQRAPARDAAFEQQPAGLRPRPLQRHRLGVRGVLQRRRIRRAAGA